MRGPPMPRRYAFLLWALLFLFCLRVLGQLLVAFAGVTFLPPMEDWFSGAIPYPALLALQALIIALYARVALDFTRGRGLFAVPRPRLGRALTGIGAAYLGVMVVRYLVRMTLFPHERWT